MQLMPIAKGLASYVPGFYTRRARRRNLRSATAAYCYEVWLKHLVLLERSPEARVPDRVAELGPGGSLGLGLAALLSGATRYYAMDIVRYSGTELNFGLLDDLVRLFRERRVPRMGWPVEAETFPSRILTDERLERTLADDRVDRIRHALGNLDGVGDDEITIRYVVPWTGAAVVPAGAVDMIFSQAVLEHVDELRGAYDAFSRWLAPGGIMSHEIDFRSHGLTRAWNGHWEYPDWAWKLVVGKKPYVINREPCSRHVQLLEERGFEVFGELRQHMEGIPRSRLAERFRWMSDDDLVTGTAVLQSRRRPKGSAGR